MSERPKVQLSKSCVVKATVGSNPTVTATEKDPAMRGPFSFRLVSWLRGFKGDKVIISKLAAGAAVIVLAFTLAGCSASSDTTPESAPEPIPEVVDESLNREVRDFNCNLVGTFTAGKWYDDNWNTYETDAYWEQKLWQKLDSADPGSWSALMELRRVTYSQNLSEPPTLGHVYAWDEATQDSDTVMIDDFLPDVVAEAAVDAAAVVCPTLDTQFWDERFHIRAFTL